MSESSRVPNVFSTPVTRDCPLWVIYDHDGPTHPTEELDNRRLCDALIITPPPVSVFHHTDWYPTFFDVVRFHRMLTDSIELQMRDRLGERRNTAVAGFARR